MRKLAFLILPGVALLSLSFRGDRDGEVDMHTIGLIKKEAFHNSQVMNTLFELTDVNGPRLTGSQGLYNAEVWAAKQLKSWGMKNVKIERWGGFGKGWQVDRAYVAMRVPYYQPIIGYPRAWTPGTEGLLTGDAVLVRADKPEELYKYKGQLRGKFVVLSSLSNMTQPNFTADARRLTDEELQKIASDPVSDAGATNLSRKPSPPARRRVNHRPRIDSFLWQEGARAVVSGGRGTMGTVFTSNGASRRWDAPPVLPEMEIGSEQLGVLGRLLEAGKHVTLEMDSWTTFLTSDSTEYNVIAEIPGTDPELKDELVMLGAHLDSWHASTGATDNATGCAVMMEAMRILKKTGVRPRRTIRLALWTGEEQGLLGSRAYVKKHFGNRLTMKLKDDQKKVSAYYNLDNGGGKIRGIYMQENEEVRPIFTGWLAPFADLGAATVTRRNTGSTDHISFDEVGIPGFQFIQDPLEYGTRTHHTNMDSYDRVSVADLQQASAIVASFVYHTAMRTKKLPRKPLPAVNTSPDSYRR